MQKRNYIGSRRKSGCLCGRLRKYTKGVVCHHLENGVVTTLLSHATNDCLANSVYVNGSDVYVVIEEQQENYKFSAKLWKNGVITNLSDDGNDDMTANDVFVK